MTDEKYPHGKLNDDDEGILDLSLRTEDYAVMQVVCPGTNGKFPGEEGADDTWGQVPVYPLQ